MQAPKTYKSSYIDICVLILQKCPQYRFIPVHGQQVETCSAILSKGHKDARKQVMHSLHIQCTTVRLLLSPTLSWRLGLAPCFSNTVTASALFSSQARNNKLRSSYMDRIRSNTSTGRRAKLTLHYWLGGGHTTSTSMVALRNVNFDTTRSHLLHYKW